MEGRRPIALPLRRRRDGAAPQGEANPQISNHWKTSRRKVPTIGKAGDDVTSRRAGFFVAPVHWQAAARPGAWTEDICASVASAVRYAANTHEKRSGIYQNREGIRRILASFRCRLACRRQNLTSTRQLLVCLHRGLARLNWILEDFDGGLLARGDFFLARIVGLLAAGKILQARANFLFARIGGLLAAGEFLHTRDVGMHADDEFLHARVGGVLDFGGEARPAEPVRAAAGRRRSYWRPCATFQ